ncbi:MAG: hypothetical protein HC913_04185 [Microscillaceae bacterium]|nr:hypothetical protein [Microscillaceae bacterium]
MADFNRDGIPEVYIYDEIFNAQTGVKLLGAGGAGNVGIISEASPLLGSVSIVTAADVRDATIIGMIIVI